MVLEASDKFEDALSDARVDLFKFYEEASRQTKVDAWTQTTWILALSGAILGFSIDLYIKHRGLSSLPAIAWGCATAGIAFSIYNIYMLSELGKHIRSYWTIANRLVASDPVLLTCFPDYRPKHIPNAEYELEFPPFIKRLMLLPILFGIGHIVWALYSVCQCAA